jgi:acyl-CoA reductase-like NAD-dependent aldehyde dehydrogenase
VQRVLVHEDVHDVGPMISEAAAERAEATVRRAVQAGAQLGCGGRRTGTLLQPTVLVDPAPTDPAVCEEMFAPVVSVLAYRDVADGIRLANATPYGLSAGVFTTSADAAFAFARGIEVGTVNVNDVSTSRVDLAPFAGIKDSGAGREGIRYAVRAFTHERLVAFALRPAV